MTQANMRWLRPSRMETAKTARCFADTWTFHELFLQWRWTNIFSPLSNVLNSWYHLHTNKNNKESGWEVDTITYSTEKKKLYKIWSKRDCIACLRDTQQKQRATSRPDVIKHLGSDLVSVALTSRVLSPEPYDEIFSKFRRSFPGTSPGAREHLTTLTSFSGSSCVEVVRVISDTQ